MFSVMYCITSTIIVLQGTTYWLLGEKNPEGNNEAVEVGSGSGLSGLSLGTENTLLSQQTKGPIDYTVGKNLPKTSVKTVFLKNLVKSQI